MRAGSPALEFRDHLQMRFKQRNLIWLGVMGALTGIAVFSPNVPPAMDMILMGSFGAAAIVSLVDVNPRDLLRRLDERTPIPLTSNRRMSPDAREAADRAASRGGALDPDLELLDIGLIALQSSRAGMSMQRSRSVSLDDDGLRPYITLKVDPVEADRHARVRFEVIDGAGNTVYIHEMKTYLRDGELNILPDHQMALDPEDDSIVTGDCDLRVYIDGELSGVLGFTLAPSVQNRFRRPATGREARTRNLADSPPPDEDDAPMSLEDLLRQQRSSE